MNGPQVWKYELTLGENRIDVPLGGRIVHAGLDPRGLACVWILVESGTPPGERIFLVVGTGHPVPTMVQHRGSWVDGDFVWHCFEVVG